MKPHSLHEFPVSAVDGAELHVEGAAGDRTVLVLHGLGYASWAAEPLRRALGDGFGVWSLDNRGTGRSAPGTESFSIDLLAADAALVAEALGGPVHVVGYSMGGYIAQILAATRPDLVASLVLMSTSGGGAQAVPVPEATRRAWLSAAGLAPEDYARATMPLSFRDGWTAEHAAEYEAVIGARLRHPTSPQVWREQYEACERFLANGYDVGGLTAPALVLHGSADRVVPVQNGRALAAAIPAVRYREIPAAGHLLHIEEPELVAAELSEFFTDQYHHQHRKEGDNDAVNRS
jgi:pimeloyl-ACP methyl ester carboxylesterase